MFSLDIQELSKYTARIYPKDLTLNKSNGNENNCHFRDLDISVLHRKLHIYYTLRQKGRIVVPNC